MSAVKKQICPKTLSVSVLTQAGIFVFLPVFFFIGKFIALQPAKLVTAAFFSL